MTFICVMLYVWHLKANLTSVCQFSAKANLRADSWSVLQPYLPVFWYELWDDHFESNHSFWSFFNLKTTVFYQKILSSFTLSDPLSNALIKCKFTPGSGEGYHSKECVQKERPWRVNMCGGPDASAFVPVSKVMPVLFIWKELLGHSLGLQLLLCALLSTIKPCCVCRGGKYAICLCLFTGFSLVFPCPFFSSE